MANLTTEFVGIKSPNPFWLASAPPTDKEYNVVRAFKAGWGGVVWKTLGEAGPPIVNVYGFQRASRYLPDRRDLNRYFPGASISKIHGQPKRVGDRLIVPMFHPAAALHQPKWRPQIIEDFSKLPQLIAQAATFSQPVDDEIDPDSAEQLSLF